MAASPDLPPPPPPTHDAALFLDFDGTLVDLAPTPDAVIVPPDLPPLLTRLAQKLGGRVAIVSGRDAANVAGKLGNPPLLVAGSHGMEIREPDGRIDAPPPPAVEAILAAMDAFAAQHPGVLVERKPFGAALHWRLAPDVETDAQALAAELAARHSLKLQPGKRVAELRPAGIDKGGAIALLMQRPAFHGAVPLAFGDDVTDEAGFVVAATLGGAGILVGEPRATAARYRLPDPAATRAWLEQAAG